jgi:hypothetical protein
MLTLDIKTDLLMTYFRMSPLIESKCSDTVKEAPHVRSRRPLIPVIFGRTWQSSEDKKRGMTYIYVR